MAMDISGTFHPLLSFWGCRLSATGRQTSCEACQQPRLTGEGRGVCATGRRVCPNENRTVIGLLPHPKDVIANQCAHWCGNPFSWKRTAGRKGDADCRVASLLAMTRLFHSPREQIILFLINASPPKKPQIRSVRSNLERKNGGAEVKPSGVRPAAERSKPIQTKRKERKV